MRRIAITGHRDLTDDVARSVDEALRRLLRAHGAALVGLSCLADGADTVFARAVLDRGDALEAIVPAQGYRDALPRQHHPGYDALLARAVLVHRLPFTESTSEAHMAAGRYMVDHADELVAVWDGAPSRGHGGTADIVGYAREAAVAVTVVWPAGAHRR